MTTDINTVAPTAADTISYMSGLPPRIRMAAFSSVSESQDKSDSIAEISKNSPAIVAFADGVSAENRSAVLLGIEFAEAVAEGKVDKDVDPVGFLKEYTLALRHAGWLTVGGSEYGEYTTTNTSLTMDSIVMELVSAIAGPNAATVMSLMSIVLDKLQTNEPAMKMFDKNSRSGNKTGFRVVPCVESSTGIPVTYLISIHATHHHNSGGALFWKWSVSKMSVRRLVKGVQFSKESFERNKHLINEYLGGEADDFFNSLKK